ncbi:MAG: menaquinone biosynthesis protein [Phycisphaerales bacterium]
MPPPDLRIACVSYLNTVPMVAGLDAAAGVELIRAVPSRIAGLVESGEADIGLASVIDLARARVPLTAVARAGMIGCRGRTLTVRLFSRVEPGAITTLHADTDSHTSTALARVILDKQFGVRPNIVDFNAREQLNSEDAPETVLLIGDKVVASSPPAVRYPHQIDLGEAWAELTGLPFVYALWACARDRVDDPKVTLAADLLERQRKRNAMRADAVIAPEARRRGWPGDLAREYVGELLHYEVGADERRAAETFLAWAAELGIIDTAALAWSDASAPAP